MRRFQHWWRDTGGTENRGRLTRGETGPSLFSQFWRTNLCFFFRFCKFLTQSWLDRSTSETTGVWPPPLLPFLSYMHSVTISIAGCTPSHRGNPAPLRCERKYFAHSYYLFICCWRCVFNNVWECVCFSKVSLYPFFEAGALAYPVFLFSARRGRACTTCCSL